jgi:hypothetical protein
MIKYVTAKPCSVSLNTELSCGHDERCFTDCVALNDELEAIEGDLSSVIVICYAFYF